MLKKRYLFLILIICLFAISAVSAEEISNNTDMIANSHDSLISESVDENLLTESYGTFQELQEEIDVVEEGGTLNLTRNYKYVNGSTNGIQISKKITINGNGFILDGNKQSRIFYFSTGEYCILDNIVFINGNSSDGGAVYASSDIKINNSIFINNVANSGGAIYYKFNSISIDNCSFENNSAVYGGTINFYDAIVRIVNSYFEDNSAVYGGVIYSTYDPMDNYLIVKNTIFLDNSADFGSIFFSNGNTISFYKGLITSIFYDSYFYSNETTEFIYLKGYNYLSLNNNTMISPNLYKIYMVDVFSKIQTNTYLILENTTSLLNRIFDVLTFTDDVGNKIKTCSPIKITLTNQETKFLMDVDAKFNMNNGVYYTIVTEPGIYDATASTECANNLTVINSIIKIFEKSNLSIFAENLIKYYGGSEKLEVSLIENGNPISNANININVDGVDYTRKTNSQGKAFVDLNLNASVYVAVVSFQGISTNVNITVNQLSSNISLTSSKNNNTVTLTAKVNPSSASGNVTFNVNGIDYKSTISNSKATVTLDNLSAGSYTAKAAYDGDINHKSSSSEIQFNIDENNQESYIFALETNKSVFQLFDNDIMWNVENFTEYVEGFGYVTYNLSKFEINGTEYTIIESHPQIFSVAIPFNPEGYEIYDGILYKINDGAVSEIIGYGDYVCINGIYYIVVGDLNPFSGELVYTFWIIHDELYKYDGSFFHQLTNGVDYNIIDDKYYTMDGKFIDCFKMEEHVYYELDYAVINSTFYQTEENFANVYSNHYSWGTGKADDYIIIEDTLYKIISGKNFRGNFYWANWYALIGTYLYEIYNSGGYVGMGIITSPINLIHDSFIIHAPNVNKYYHGPERFVVTLTDDSDKPIVNTEVKIIINGNTYTRITDNKGMASMAINLNSGIYNVITQFNSSEIYSTIIIKSTVSGENVTKMFRNGTQYYATFYDTSGKTLAENTPVEFNINGVFYTRYTNNQGVARMNINLNPGEYIITAKNPNSGEQYTNIIKVLPSIVENYDLTKYYRNASQYSLRLLDDKGNPVKAGVDVRLNINGVFYTRTSNADGYVKMNINLEPGEYTITAEYNGLMASNKIKVLSVIETHDLSMKYKDGSKFEAKILDGQGNPYPGQTVTFNINGVFYERITDENGIARLSINLMAGKYIITSSYNGLNAANTVTISS